MRRNKPWRGISSLVSFGCPAFARWQMLFDACSCSVYSGVAVSSIRDTVLYFEYELHSELIIVRKDAAPDKYLSLGIITESGVFRMDFRRNDPNCL